MMNRVASKRIEFLEKTVTDLEEQRSGLLVRAQAEVRVYIPFDRRRQRFLTYHKKIRHKLYYCQEAFGNFAHLEGGLRKRFSRWCVWCHGDFSIIFVMYYRMGGKSDSKNADPACIF